jgi:hypothetical protein
MLADKEFVAQLLDEDPKSAAQLWQELRLKISEELKRLEEGTEFTRGRQELSLKSHIVAALESMESLDLVTAHMVKQMVDLDEKEWLRTDRVAAHTKSISWQKRVEASFPHQK